MHNTIVCMYSYCICFYRTAFLWSKLNKMNRSRTNHLNFNCSPSIISTALLEIPLVEWFILARRNFAMFIGSLGGKREERDGGFTEWWVAVQFSRSELSGAFDTGFSLSLGVGGIADRCSDSLSVGGICPFIVPSPYCISHFHDSNTLLFSETFLIIINWMFL